MKHSLRIYLKHVHSKLVFVHVIILITWNELNHENKCNKNIDSYNYTYNVLWKKSADLLFIEYAWN